MKYLNDNYYVTAIIKVLNIKITKNLITKYIDICIYRAKLFAPRFTVCPRTIWHNTEFHGSSSTSKS